MLEFLFGAMVIILFFLIGIGLVWAGVRSWLNMVRIRPRLLTAQGVITNIITESKAMRTSNESKSYAVHRFPVIHFHTQEGKAQSFRSEVGEVERRYRRRAWWPARPAAHRYRLHARRQARQRWRQQQEPRRQARWWQRRPARPAAHPLRPHRLNAARLRRKRTSVRFFLGRTLSDH